MTQVLSRGGSTIGRSSRAHRFPAFQLAPGPGGGVDMGSIKVLARAPSGRTQQLGVTVDGGSGQYTTDFVPNEIGEWVVSIMSDGVNISGSPFTVRVYDPGQVKVNGLQGGAMGMPVCFNVDTSGAGEGALTVDVLYNNLSVPCQISPNGAQGYGVCFNPVGPGTYLIHVCYASQEVAGSPFTVDIISSGTVMLSGDGLSCCRVNDNAFFIVNMGENAGLPADLSIRVTSPSGRELPTQVTAVGGGCSDFRVDFQPREVGDHTIEVCYYGQLVQGCPYICKVYDFNQITVANMPARSLIGRLVTFDIDAVDSGSGKLDIIVNGGAVPCSVEKQGGRRFRGSFAPPVTGVYTVEMQFNGCALNGSPWKVEVIDASHVRIEGAQRNCVRVDTPTGFNVLTAPYDGIIGVNIRGSSGNLVDVSVTRPNDEVYRVDFVPTEIGTYDVSVTYEGLVVLGSPFQLCACDPSAILVSTVPFVILGCPVEFNVDASAAGPGDLELQVNKGTVPSKAEQLGPSNYMVSYLPPSAGPYYTDIQFNGKTLPQSPLLTTVIDVGALKLSAGAPLYARVGRPRIVRVDTQCTGGDAPLLISILSPCGEVVPARVTAVMGGYEVEFMPLEAGPYTVSADYAGVHAPCGPVTVCAYDVSRIRVLGVVDGLVGCKSAFSVGLNDCGEGELEVVVMSCHGRPVLNQVTVLEPGRLEVTYEPMEGGLHFAEVTFNKEHVTGSPFQFQVYDACRASARGDGLSLVQCNQRATFVVMAPDAKLCDIDVKITSPTGRDVLPTIVDSKAGSFRVDYTPTQTGVYQVEVTYFGACIPCSPFAVKAWDAGKVIIAGLSRGQVCVESAFSIELAEAGDGTIEISITDPNGQLIPNQVVTKGPGLLEVHYVPNVAGDHRVNVVFNGQKVPGCPLTFSVLDASRVTARGEGLGLVQVGKPAWFIVSAPDAKLRDLDIRVIGPTGSELLTNISETSPGNFKVDYTPNCVGPYQIPIVYSCTAITGSPFMAHAWDASRVLLADISTGQVGCPSSFKVIVAEAGEGVVEISITDPIGQLVANQASALEPGVVAVNFVPTVVGQHRGNVLFNKQKVPASPFTFLVVDPSKVTCQGPALSLVPVKRLTSCVINAPPAQRKDIDIRVLGPNGQDLYTNLVEVNPSSFKVEFTPLIAGDQLIQVLYFGSPACTGPWLCKAYDVNKVLCSSIPLGQVGCPSIFSVDMREAGEGRLEISLIGPTGQTLENSVSPVAGAPGVFQVSCMPESCGTHRANVTFNDEQALGSPFTFLVTDPSGVSASGEGLGSVRCGRQTSFIITAPCAQSKDLAVKITGPRNRDIAYRLQDRSGGCFNVDYTPINPGEHLIEVRYFGCPIRDSPFHPIAWDPNLILVNNIRSGMICKPTTFNISAGAAGPGNLEVAITARGECVRNVARKVDSSGLIEVSYTSINTDPHIINVNFNGEPVNGSPFVANVLDGSLATAQGPGLGRVIANCVTQFDVITRPIGGDADVQVFITSPSGQNVPAYVTGSASNNFRVEYCPVEAGRHVINVVCACMDIRGSPFSPDCFDPSQVRVQRVQCGVVGKPVNFKIDSSMAGQGRVTVDVRGASTHPGVDVSPPSNGITLVSFVPLEGATHNIIVKFNDCDVPGCPFPCQIIDQKALQVRWDAIRLVPVGRPALVELDSTSSPEAHVICTVIDPYGNEVPTQQRRVGTICGCVFVPMTVGAHTVSLHYGCDSVPGSPFTCNVYDAARVRIIDATACGNIGQDVSFVVDTSEAGIGVLEAGVTCGGAMVPVRQSQGGVGADRTRFTFVARSPTDHIIELTFNGETVPGSPLVWRIVNPASQLTLTNGSPCKAVAIGQLVWGIVQSPGFPINTCDITAKVACPTGELVPTRISPQQDGSVRIEYTSQYIGMHLLQAEYACQTIPGSPLAIEVFDPNRIQLEGARVGEVNQPMVVDINYASAGAADLGVTVTDPSGGVVPFEAEQTTSGQRIVYVPVVPGAYKVHATYGCMDIPGCPVTQDIRALIPVCAAGEGLFRGVANCISTFIVDPKGQRGELLAQIQGPSTLARIQIEPEGGAGGCLKVCYQPLEVGVFSVNLQFNGVEVEGCPFHPRIVDPSAVQVIDDPCDWTGPDRFMVALNELRSIHFDTSCAGPGQLTATIEGPGGKLNPDVLPLGMDGYVVKFVPRTPGDYYIRVYWSDLPICLFPLVATAPAPPKAPQDQLVVMCECDGPAAPALDASQLVLSGQGLVSACVGEPAQFIIDGSRAGPGIPVVRMVGVQDELEVLVEPIEDNVYCCTYQSTKSGAYLLSVLWGDQAAPYSPYKVTVQTGSDVSRVVCSGDGLTSGILGETFNVLVDARRAGVGELSVRCQGPTRPAYCDIEDRHDDTYEISVRPLELGIHQLFITFGGEQVIGSPFNVRVTSAPDASKVCVSGSGIRNGLLATFQSDFTVDTTQAGPGQLSVKVRARRGAFRVEMRRSAQSDRVIECSYHPTEVGEYFIHVQWSGQHVPCSPFRVLLVDTLQELRRLEGGAGGALLPSGGDSDWGSVSKMDGGGPPAGYYIEDY